MLRTKAGVHGCDAVVVTAFDAIGTKWSRMGYRGTCIVYAATSAGE